MAPPILPKRLLIGEGGESFTNVPSGRLLTREQLASRSGISDFDTPGPASEPSGPRARTTKSQGSGGTFDRGPLDARLEPFVNIDERGNRTLKDDELLRRFRVDRQTGLEGIPVADRTGRTGKNFRATTGFEELDDQTRDLLLREIAQGTTASDAFKNQFLATNPAFFEMQDQFTATQERIKTGQQATNERLARQGEADRESARRQTASEERLAQGKRDTRRSAILEASQRARERLSSQNLRRLSSARSATLGGGTLGSRGITRRAGFGSSSETNNLSAGILG
jgi:hypothetical protein